MDKEAVVQTQFNIAEAKARLSEIVGIVEDGGTVTLARRGKPVATIVPVESERTVRRKLFPLRGQLGKAPDFDEPMSEEELALWYGGEGRDT